MALKLRIQIKGITKPPVWRELLIPDSFSFRQLHYAIQLAFDWLTEHLYQFQKQPFGQGWCIGEPEEDDGMFSEPTTPAATVNVRRFIEENGIDKFVYVYDFGDSWVHQITVETLTNDKIKLPRCLAGKGTPPPEDCGGAFGYEELKQILMKDDPDAEEIERLEWYGMYDEEDEEPYDIHFCDIDQINHDLRYFRSFAKDMDAVYDRNIMDGLEYDDDDSDVLSPEDRDFVRKVIHDKDDSLLPNDISENIQRIQKYEATYENLIALSSELESAHSDKERNKIARKLSNECEKLMGYLFSTDWMIDVLLDQRGKLPAGLKRDVLKQETLTNLLDKLEGMEDIM